MIFRRLFKSDAHRIEVRGVYDAIVAQARQPAFYAALGVPDTVSGRFDMIVLHAFLVLERLRQGGEQTVAFSQALTDELFLDMDRSLREMGVGDLSVAPKVRRMLEVFHGRLTAYRAAAEAEEGAFAAALRRNVYAGEDAAGNAGRLAIYTETAARAVDDLTAQDIMAGHLNFGAAERVLEAERT